MILKDNVVVVTMSTLATVRLCISPNSFNLLFIFVYEVCHFTLHAFFLFWITVEVTCMWLFIYFILFFLCIIWELIVANYVFGVVL